MALLTTTGCIVAAPPEYEEPKRTPPILDLYSAKPFTGAVISVDRLENPPVKVEWKVPVRSDDQGEGLFWVQYVDRTFLGEAVTSFADVPASTMDDTTRYVQGSWVPDSHFSKGCHTLSIVIAHNTSWNRVVHPPLLLDPSDAALGTWWLNLDPAPGTDPNTLVHCPSRAEIQQ
jgi:hypothetical protein